jgi:hypothetical protein
MDWPDYLRDEAAKYRQLAEQADDPLVKNELLELASVCEEVASNIEGSSDGWVAGHPRGGLPLLFNLAGSKPVAFADVRFGA